jgi:hypothetical protein
MSNCLTSVQISIQVHIFSMLFKLHFLCDKFELKQYKTYIGGQNQPKNVEEVVI